MQSESNDADQMRNKEGYDHDSIAIRNAKKQNANGTNQCNAISITNKFGIPSLAANGNANMHMTQSSRTNSNENYVLTKKNVTCLWFV